MKHLDVADLLCVLSLVLPYASSLACLQCDSAIQPRFCQDVEQCGPHEFCPVNGPAVGKRSQQNMTSISETYNLGKPREKKEAAVCVECCDTDLCNSGGCGTQGFNLGLGPICYSCPAQIGTNGCQKIEQCGRDKICRITSLSLPGESNAYMTSCVHPQDCTSMPSTASGQCSACCSSSLCNSFTSQSALCNAPPYKTTTSGLTMVTMPATTMITTPTTTLVTMPATATVKHFTLAPTKTSTMKVPTIPTTKPPLKGCYYKYKIYQQGETWFDGCDYVCQCVDGQKHFFNCKPICLTWKLPTVCHMRPAFPGKCCPEPVCPAHVIVKYPSDYVQYNCSTPCLTP